MRKMPQSIAQAIANHEAISITTVISRLMATLPLPTSVAVLIIDSLASDLLHLIDGWHLAMTVSI